MINDYELIYLAQENIEEAKNILYDKYINYIYVIISKAYQKYRLYTTDIEDLKLDCYIVIENAINKYNQDKDTKFKTYLKKCVETRLTDIIRKNLSYKGKIINNMISLDSIKDGMSLHDILYDNNYLIEDNFFDIDDFIINIKPKLSTNEKNILILILDGIKPEEMAILLNIDIKNINNTIYRLKTKIKTILGG